MARKRTDCGKLVSSSVATVCDENIITNDSSLLSRPKNVCEGLYKQLVIGLNVVVASHQTSTVGALGRDFRQKDDRKLDRPLDQQHVLGRINVHLRYLDLHGRRLRHTPRSPHRDIHGSSSSGSSTRRARGSCWEIWWIFDFQSYLGVQTPQAVQVLLGHDQVFWAGL